MYDESVHQHGFGKLGGLREIALAQEKGYKWWYAGFYIHNCVKMRYKGDYNPQYILDPESFTWDLLDANVKKKLDETKYLSLSSEKALGTNDTEQATALADSGNAVIIDPVAHDDDSDDDPEVQNPDLPLFSRGVPGIMTKEQILEQVDLDHIKLRVRGREAETCQLVGWDDGDVDSAHSIKGIIAELVAAVGPECARQMVVSFS